MNDKVILGIHSTVDPNVQGSFNQFVDGHAWLSVTRNGRTEYYGLWPDGHPDVPDNGDGTDIRRGMEAGASASASRYYELTPEQATKLEAALKENVTWRYTNTCASWASETVESVTGRSMNADDALGFETPRKLIETIREQERQQPTSLSNPLPANTPRPSSSGLFGSVDSMSDEELKTHLAALTSDPQRQQEWNGLVAASRQEPAAREQPAEPARETPEPGQIGIGRA